ncbi:MAG TPA: ATP-binding protein [Polyangiaceae bacterium]|nr:ATP-binding protein [Polyangiaceae bacterium]
MGIVSLVTHASGRRNVDYLLFSLIAWVVAAQSVACGFCCLRGDLPTQWMLATTFAESASVMAAALHVHFAMRCTGVRRQLEGAAVTYAIAFVLIFMMLHGSGMRAPLSNVGPLTEKEPHTWFATMYVVAIPVFHVIACALFGRSVQRKRRDSLALFTGAVLFALAAVNDMLVGSGVIRGLSLLPLGLIVFSTVLVILFLRRYNLVRQEYAQHAKSLNERGRQLREARRALRELQNELGRKEQLAAIGEMAAVIAHEVRNPLAVITNAVASLKREGLSRHDHDVLLSILEEESERLNRLVSDLLNYARPINLQRQRLVLHEVCQRAMLVGTIHNARLVFDENSARGQIWGDVNLLRQVFDNLVENAVQATDGSGTVTLSIRAASRETAEGFIVTVSDDGEGMDTQVRSRAKDPFFTTRPTGTGLGLAIVNRIVETHGGEMWFESSSGEGTTVNVFLPIGKENSVPPEPRRLIDTLPPRSEPSVYDELKD